MTKANKPAPSYDKLKAELEAILTDLQRDDLDVDQALEHYKRGLELVRQLGQYLETAENEIHGFPAAPRGQVHRGAHQDPAPVIFGPFTPRYPQSPRVARTIGRLVAVGPHHATIIRENLTGPAL